MQKLSAVIITFNEERNIERCINSLHGVVDEIVVLDSNSTDSTKTICEKHKITFNTREWEGYSKSKNHANTLASNDWILSIDADEALSEVLKKSIKDIKEKLDLNSVYSFNRLTNYCGKWIRHCGWYPDKKIRIFNRKNVEWEGEIHETLHYLQSVKEIHLKGDLLHYSYYSKEEHIKQTEKFSSLSAEEMYKKGKRANALKPFISVLVKFITDYFIKLGVLDGKEGFEICKTSARSNFLKYKKLIVLSRS